MPVRRTTVSASGDAGIVLAIGRVKLSLSSP
jgi:hypothetical protein